MKLKQTIKNLMLAGLIVIIQACNNSKSQPEDSQYPVMTIEKSQKTLSKSYSATIRGRQDISIYSQISGKITEVSVMEGQTVKRGQILFIVDQIPYKAEMRVAEANYQAAKVGLETATLNYNSIKELYNNQVVSAYELQTAQNNLHIAEATLAQAEAQKVNAENNLSYTEIRSPANGVIGALPYREGTLVSATMAESLTTVSDNSEVYVYFSINENNLLEMARTYGTLESALKQMPDVELRLGDGSIYNRPGRVESISGVINENTGTASLRAVFSNPDGLLRSGSNGSVIIPETYNDIVLIPQESTFDLQDKVFVYKVVDGVTKSTRITVSPTSDGKEYIVLEGLESGDEIISSGAGLLRDGLPVQRITNIANNERE